VARVSLRRAERVSAILDRLAVEHTLHAADLAREFGVSGATLRRDLQMLEDQKLLARTHGGAAAAEVSYELPVRYRGGRNRELKQQIARAAADLLPKGPLTLGLTGGTTTSAVARAISSRVDLTVVTNALNIATELALRPRLKVLMTGGVARAQSYELVGPFAEQTLAGLRLEVAVVGVDGISAEAGLTTHDEVEAHTNRSMITRAARVMVVADGSKVGRTTLAWICPVTSVSSIVTDASADPEALDALRKAGLGVHIVG
jgi:DeoR family transcriptional regulator, aga operon transcriptional repressor